MVPFLESIEINDPDSLLVSTSNESIHDSSRVISSSFSTLGEREVFERFALVQVRVLGSKRVSNTLEEMILMFSSRPLRIAVDQDSQE
jgi:hypothetical protein